MPGWQHEQQTRQEKNQPRVTQVDRSMRDLVNLPRHRNALRLGAHDHSDPRQLITRKVPRGKRLNAASGFLKSRGTHRLPLGYIAGCPAIATSLFLWLGWDRSIYEYRRVLQGLATETWDYITTLSLQP